MFSEYDILVLMKTPLSRTFKDERPRFVYNKMLHDRKLNFHRFQEHGIKTKHPTPASYKTEFPFLKEVDSLALANAQLNLNEAYKNFFSDPSVGFPNFKNKKSNYNSYTTNNQNGTVSIIDNQLKLPKLKNFI